MRDYLTGQLDAKILEIARPCAAAGPMARTRPTVRLRPRRGASRRSRQRRSPGTIGHPAAPSDAVRRRRAAAGERRWNALPARRRGARGQCPPTAEAHQVEVARTTGPTGSAVDDEAACRSPASHRRGRRRGRLAHPAGSSRSARWRCVLAGIGGSILVRRQLRPLTDVAATAHAVADQPLDSGTVELAARSPTTSPTRTPRSARSARRSTPCSPTSSRRSTRGTGASSRCASSSPTRATSCARR